MPVEVDALVGGAKKVEPMMRPFRTSKERYARIDAAIERYGFKSSNKFLEQAADWFIGQLEEAERKKAGKR